MTIGKTDVSVRKLLKRPLSDRVGYVLTALIVILIWTFGVVFTSLDFDMLRTSYSENGSPRSIKAAILTDASLFGEATGVKKVKDQFSWTTPNGAITNHYVTAQIKGGRGDGYYVIASVQEDVQKKEFFADILSYARTQEQNKLAADAVIEYAKISKAESENIYGEIPDLDSIIVYKYFGEFTSISDLNVEYDNEYEIPAGEDEWCKTKDSFYFFTSEDYYLSGEMVTKYKIVRATTGGMYEGQEPNLRDVAECDSEAERQSIWEETLALYQQSMQAGKEAGEYRF